MEQPIYMKCFAKDIKKSEKEGKDLEKFKQIAQTLILGQALDAKYRDHKLIGNYQNCRECHIKAG